MCSLRFQVIDPEDMSQRARWTIIATACLLLLMCLLLVGVTLRMAPLIDDMGKSHYIPFPYAVELQFFFLNYESWRYQQYLCIWFNSTILFMNWKNRLLFPFFTKIEWTTGVFSGRFLFYQKERNYFIIETRIWHIGTSLAQQGNKCVVIDFCLGNVTHEWIQLTNIEKYEVFW